MKTMKDYYEIVTTSTKCDAFLLVDVFEKFRNDSLNNYELYPSHILNAPGLSWEAMLKMTKIKLELITDPVMYIFCKKVQQEEILIFVIDTAKPTINI